MSIHNCPDLSVDIVCRWRESILIIERKNKPFGLALPGGMVDIGETVETAVLRELAEETNVRGKILGFVGVYSEPSRDPRTHIVSLAYAVEADEEDDPTAMDDAKELHIVTVGQALDLRLVCDHHQILEDAVNYVFERRIYG